MLGAPANITMHAGCWLLVLLQTSWYMQDADCWCSCKDHNACRMLTIGALAKITIHAGCWLLVLLWTSQYMQDTGPWCFCEHYDMCRTLSLDAFVNIMILAGWWSLVLLQTSWCHLAMSQLWLCKNIMMSQEFLGPGTPEEITMFFKAVPGWYHDFVTWTGVEGF